MDYWGNASMEAAKRQIAITSAFSSEKRFKIALDFANFGVDQTQKWIKSKHPEFSELEVRLEFVRLMSYETGRISEEHWHHFKKIMEDRIQKHWAARFRNMMKEMNWTYNDVARFGRFKNGNVVEATISRGLPSFAKLAVLVFEQRQLSAQTEQNQSLQPEI